VKGAAKATLKRIEIEINLTLPLPPAVKGEASANPLAWRERGKGEGVIQATIKG
jgi:hypothetical protein